MNEWMNERCFFLDIFQILHNGWPPPPPIGQIYSEQQEGCTRGGGNLWADVLHSFHGFADFGNFLLFLPFSNSFPRHSNRSPTNGSRSVPSSTSSNSILWSRMCTTAIWTRNKKNNCPIIRFFTNFRFFLFWQIFPPLTHLTLPHSALIHLH